MVAFGVVLLALCVYSADTLLLCYSFFGSVDDLGWTYAQNVAREAIDARFDSRSMYVEGVHTMMGADWPFPATDAQIEVYQGFMDAGCDFVISGSSLLGAVTAMFANKYPEVKFLNIAGLADIASLPNAASVYVRMYQARYVAGVVAASTPNVKRLGFIGSMTTFTSGGGPIPESARDINAFLLGARSVNPNIEVDAIYTGSWFAPRAEEIAGMRLWSIHGVNAIAYDSDSDTTCAIAKKLDRLPPTFESPKFAIGHKADCALLYSYSSLTSTLYQYEQTLSELIIGALDGTWSNPMPNLTTWHGGSLVKDKNSFVGFEKRAVGMGAASRFVPFASKKQAKYVVDQFSSGQDHVFCPTSGEFKDNLGNVHKVADDPLSRDGCFSDAYLFHGMTWFIEGINFHGQLDLPSTCSAGTFFDPLASELCVSCVPGTFTDEPEQMGCKMCRPGTYNGNSGSTSCKPCVAGTIQSAKGQTFCMGCPPGAFSSFFASTCTPCEAGKSADSIGAVTCKVCESGKYISTQGASACAICPPTTETRLPGSATVGDCACPEYSYYLSDAGRCFECTEKERTGLRCPGGFAPYVDSGGSNASTLGTLVDNTVVVKDSYMVTYQAAKLMVFECPQSLRCLDDRHVFSDGAFNAKEMCRGFSHGFGCAACDPNTFRATDGMCKGCMGFVLPTILAGCIGTIVLSLFVIYNTMLIPDPVSVEKVILFAFVQTIALFITFDVKYPRVVQQTSIGTNVLLNADLSTLSVPVACITGDTFLSEFTSALFTPLLLVCGIFTIYVVGRYGSPITRRVFSNVIVPQVRTFHKVYVIMDRAADGLCGFPLSVQLRWFWPLKWVDFVNSVIALMSRLFITTSNLALSLFKVYTHPSGTRTLFSFRQVQEYSSDWWTAVPVSIMALCIYILVPFAYMTYIVIVAPQRFGDSTTGEQFRQSHRNMWLMFHPGSWWFGLTQLLYGLSLNLIIALCKSVRTQIMASILVTTLAALLTIFARPWRFEVNLHSEIVAKVGAIAFLVIMMNSDLGDPPGERTLGVLTMVFITFPIVLIIAQALRYIFTDTLRAVKRTRERAELIQRFHDVALIVGAMTIFDLRQYARQMNDKDFGVLSQACDTVMSTMHGLQPKQFWRRRCMEVPFEVNFDGRLEGRVRALGLESSEDAREEIRKLRRGLLRCKSLRGSAKSLSSSAPIGYDPIRDIFLRVEGDFGSATEAEFVEAVSTYLAESLPPEDFEIYECSEKEISNIFKYCDLSSEGRIARHEFSEMLWATPEPHSETITFSRSLSRFVAEVNALPDYPHVNENGGGTCDEAKNEDLLDNIRDRKVKRVAVLVEL